MKGKISYVLKTLSIMPHLRGWDYIIEAVEMVMEDHDVMLHMTKRLYPVIAKKYNTTPSRVERAIRHAITDCFENAPVEVLYGVFGNMIGAYTGKVSNGCFIATLAYMLANEPNHPIFKGSIYESKEAV